MTVTAQESPSTIATTSADLTIGGGAIVSIPVIALTYGIVAGTITITDPTLANSQTWTTSGSSNGDTGISVTSDTPNFDYPAGSTISGTQLYVIPVLSQFSLDSLGFVNLIEADIPAGTSANLTLTAVQSGLIFNGAGSGGNVQSVQQLQWVETITILTSASNGQDPEDDSHYLNRLKADLQLQAPRPITEADYGSMALNFTPYPGTDQQEVGRATSVDGYNPVDQTFGNERMVTVSVTDVNGFALNSDTLYGYPNGSFANIVTTIPSPNAGWGIAGWLGSLRELGFVVNLINPTYSPVYVTVTVKASTGWDSTSIQTNVQSALLSYLSPQAWGLPSSNVFGWQNSTTIFQSRLNQVIQNSGGIDHILDGTLRFGASSSPSNTLDLVIPGPIALPTSTVVTIPLAAITVV